jgi:hypothetical protein
LDQICLPCRTLTTTALYCSDAMMERMYSG